MADFSPGFFVGRENKFASTDLSYQIVRSIDKAKGRGQY
jgi:hypothetical protein